MVVRIVVFHRLKRNQIKSPYDKIDLNVLKEIVEKTTIRMKFMSH